MPLTTEQIVRAVRAAGLPDFTPRKLERWGNLGVLPHAVPRGRGPGKGWEFLWPDEALWIALFVADAFSWQKSRRFEDAVLWAWLRGAPVALPVARKLLVESLQRQSQWLERHLQRRRRRKDDEPLDLVDRLSAVFARRHDTLRAFDVPMDVRLGGLRQTLAQLQGQRWSNSTEAHAAYQAVWNSLMRPLGIEWDTSTKETARQQRFFQYKHLARLVLSTKDENLLAARDAFAVPFLEMSTVVEDIESARRVSAERKAWAESTYRLYSIYFEMDPAWVAALFLYSVMSERPVGSGRKL